MSVINKYKQEPIAMPEYGRHIQNMVNYCIQIEDREARNRCAHNIVRTMSGLLPERRESLDSDQVYWDHLALISKFKLDVDYPEGTITEEQHHAKPDKLPYPTGKLRYRYYGSIIEGMIARVRSMEHGAERAALEYFIALQMKRSYMTWNSDTVDDLKIFKDIFEISEGDIMLTPENCKLSINPNSIDRTGRQRVSKKQLKRK
ncbi:MAG: DUF4290 domain-containing protein [Porphyromonadaceae bacterium]|nr:DUF4290 domain-containing protein [Porphyromonadaceae bacterium]